MTNQRYHSGYINLSTYQPINITFQYPQAFYLFAVLPLLLLLFVLYRRWHRKVKKRIGDPVLVDKLLGGYVPSRGWLNFAILLLSFVMGILSLANPQREGESEPDIRNGIDLVLAVDVSKSMLATDVLPSRLSAAKTVIINLLKARPNDRVGLVLFAGHAYAQLPLTYDHGNAELLINAIDPMAFTAQGTAVADALKVSKDILSVSTGRYKTVILLSDGETFDDASEDGNALEWAAQLRDSGIPVFTVGFGSPSGTTLIDPLTKSIKKDRAGANVISKLDENLLQSIAQRTDARYLLYADNQQAVKGLGQNLATIKDTALVDKSLLSFQTLYPWVTVPMLLLLLVELFIPDRKRKVA